MALFCQCGWTRILAAFNSPASCLQNKVLLNQLEQQLLSLPQITQFTVKHVTFSFRVHLFWLLSVITREILSLSTLSFFAGHSWALCSLHPKLQVKAQRPEHYSVVPTAPYQDLLCCNYVVSYKHKTLKPFLYIWVETHRATNIWSVWTKKAEMTSP